MDREMQNGEMQRRLTPEERALRVKKMKRGRRIRLAIVVVGFFLALCLVIVPIIFFTVFRVKNIQVEGSTLYTQEELIDASGIEIGENLFFVDVEGGAEAIEKNLPYSNNVAIKKKLPNTLIFYVETTDKAYAVEISEGTYAVTNPELKVLEVSGVIPEKVVPIIVDKPAFYELGEKLAFITEKDDETTKDKDASEEPAEPVVDQTFMLISEILNAINEYEIKDISLINVRSTTNIYLIYQERIVLRLGDSSDIASKLSLGKRAVEDEQNADIVTGTVNLTVSHQAYVHSSDYRDIPELMEYNPEGYKPPEEVTEDTTKEEASEEKTTEAEE